MNNLKEKTLRGGFAKVCAQGASFVLRIGSLVVLARLLDPKDFGLVGMVTVLTGVFNLFRDAGLSTVTVQRSSISEEQLSTLFWMNMVVGGLMALLTAAGAPMLVAFYHEPRLVRVTFALALGFILNAAGVQHSALLQRQMRFGALAAVETLALLASIIVGIGMASRGFGYWALVWMALMVPAASTLGFWLIAGWIPGLPRRGTGLRSMMRFGGTVTLNNLIVYIGYNTDKLLMGRVWGAEMLGIYGRAYQLVSIPTENLNSAVGSVAVSALSRVQSDHERFRSYFLKGYSLTLTLTIPVTIACALFARDIIAVLLGAKWMGAVTIFRFLAPTILAFALINPLYWLLVSSGHVARSLKMAVVIAPLVTLSYAVGISFGPSGVALGYSAMMTLLTLPLIVWATHGLVVSWRDILGAVRPPFVAAAVATVISLASARLWEPLLTPLPRLILEGSVVLASYIVTLLSDRTQRTFYVDLIRELTPSSPLRTVRVEAATVDR